MSAYSLVTQGLWNLGDATAQNIWFSTTHCDHIATNPLYTMTCTLCSDTPLYVSGMWNVHNEHTSCCAILWKVSQHNWIQVLSQLTLGLAVKLKVRFICLDALLA